MRLQVALHIRSISTFLKCYHIPNLEVHISRSGRTVIGPQFFLHESFRGPHLVRLWGLLPTTALATAVISFGACRSIVACIMQNHAFTNTTSFSPIHLRMPGAQSLLGNLDQPLISTQRFQGPL